MLLAQSWQLPNAFLPFCMFELFNPSHSDYYILYLPFFCLLVIDIHVLPTDMEWKGFKKYLPYLFSLPLSIWFIFHIQSLFKGDSLAFKIWGTIIGLLITTFVGKMWFGDVVLLIINRLRLKEVTEITCTFRKQRAERAYRHIKFMVQLSSMEAIETSGFFYFYLKLYKVEEGDLLKIKIKRGCLGLEFISGFPKIVERKKNIPLSVK
ncbi:hypothetical protein DRW42_25395 [Pedobacter miscanthi]|uniref:Uncharacterized protein n=2 Tax=Pedobacter miscanthi TaxID=2259170 RepID=A0A366KN27_9SPHI|nr:hypothetical protein DRW42_25395 [Pedobacter miscanthi]